MSNDLNSCVRQMLNSLDVCYDNIDYNNQMIVRCPFCGDSSNETHAHMYVKLSTEPGEPIVYYCHKCNAGGILDQYVVDLLGVYDNDFEYLNKSNLSYSSKKIGSKLNIKNKIKKMILLPPLNNNQTKLKIDYIENRLGIKLSAKDIIDYKMVFNFRDYLAYNHINKYTRHELIMQGLDNEYVGFITNNNEFIQSRRIYDTKDKYLKRYINYNIFGLQNNTKRFYTLKNNLRYMDRLTIVLAEGAMDILGIFNHIYNKKYDDNILFMAVGGLGYNNAIKYITKLGTLFYDIYIYSDNTVELQYYRNLKYELGMLFKHNRLIVCYNSKFKDCGTTKDNIDIEEYEI